MINAFGIEDGVVSKDWAEYDRQRGNTATGKSVQSNKKGKFRTRREARHAGEADLAVGGLVAGTSGANAARAYRHAGDKTAEAAVLRGQSKTAAIKGDGARRTTTPTHPPVGGSAAYHYRSANKANTAAHRAAQAAKVARRAGRGQAAWAAAGAVGAVVGARTVKHNRKVKKSAGRLVTKGMVGKSAFGVDLGGQ